MAVKQIPDLIAGAAADGHELAEVSQKSATVTISATTISAAASDNSFNDSGSGFVTAGFADDDRVIVEGFATGANNLIGKIESAAAGKLIVESPAGDAIVDEAAGESVTITKLVTRRISAQDIADLGGGGGSVSVEDDSSEIVAVASKLNFTGDGVTVTDAGSGEAEIAIPGGGGGGSGGGLWTLIEVAELSADASVDLEDFAGGDYAALLIVADLKMSDNGVGLSAQYKLNGSYQSSGDYNAVIYQRSTSGSTEITDSTTATGGYLSGVGGTWGIGNDTTEAIQLKAEIINPMAGTNPLTTNIQGMHGVPSGQRTAFWGSFEYDGADYANALEGLRIAVDTGTMTGKIYVYALSATATTNSSVRVSATHWRMMMASEAPNSGEDVAVGELRFKDSGGSNVSTGGTAISSSDFDGTFDADAAFDGTTTGVNGWAAGNARAVGEWLGYAHASAVAIHSVEVFPYGDDLTQTPRDMVLAYSTDDGETWTPHTYWRVPDAWVAGTGQTLIVPPFVAPGAPSPSAPLDSYTVATLPSVAPAGQTIYVTDETGGAVPAFSDGTNWRRMTDRAIVS